MWFTTSKRRKTIHPEKKEQMFGKYRFVGPSVTRRPGRTSIQGVLPGFPLWLSHSSSHSTLVTYEDNSLERAFYLNSFRQ